MRWVLVGLAAVIALNSPEAYAGPIARACMTAAFRRVLNLPDTSGIRSWSSSYAHTLLSKIYANPELHLTADDLTLIKSAGLEEAASLAAASGDLKRKFASNWLNFHLIKKKNWGEMGPLIRRVLGNPESSITSDERALLQSAGIPEDWLRDVSRENGKTLGRLLRLSMARPYAFLALAAAAVGADFLGEEVVSPEDQGRATEIENDEFEMIYSNAAGLPIGDIHPDIRIGDDLYSFQGGPGVAPIGKGSISDLSQTEHSIRIRFRLTKPQVDELRKYLDSKVGESYIYMPLLLEVCNVATARAIRNGGGVNIPEGIDRSATLTKFWFKLQHWMGVGHVESIKLYAPDRWHKLGGIPVGLAEAWAVLMLYPEAWFLSGVESQVPSWTFKSGPER